MKNKKPTVTIGIPAYNEEANIKNLLASLLAQKQINFRLREIIVISDGSTDQTARLAKSVTDKRLNVISYKKRLGAALRQNQIFELAQGDIVVLLNADIFIVDQDFLSKMVNTYLKSKNIGIVAPRTVPTSSSSLIGKLLEWHANWKQELFEALNNQDNIYLCKGTARGFSKKAYKNFSWPQTYGEDAFSYLAVKKIGLDFYYCKDAVIYFQPPQNLKDHSLQSVRFLHSKLALAEHFTQQELKTAYAIPKKLFIKLALNGIFNNPSKAVSYIVIHAYCKLLSLAKKPNSQAHLWEISTSTKTISNN